MALSPPPDFALQQALEPFSTEEADRLRRYVELAEDLKACRFFQQRKQTLEITFSSSTFLLERDADYKWHGVAGAPRRSA
jgi:hypothetical protein